MEVDLAKEIILELIGNFGICCGICEIIFMVYFLLVVVYVFMSRKIAIFVCFANVFKKSIKLLYDPSYFYLYF